MSEMAPTYEDDLKATTKKYKGIAGYGPTGADLAARASLKNRWTLDDNENFVRKGANQDFVRNAPVQQAHDSIDSDSGGLPGGPMNAPGQEPRTNAEGDYVYDDNIDDMFGAVGGLGDKDDEASVDAPPEKLGWGKRIWSGLKGLGGFVKNLSGYNAIRHGLIGANFRRGKVRKNMAKVQALQERLGDIKTQSRLGNNIVTPEEGDQIQRQFDGAEKKLVHNQKKLGEHRRYYKGKEWKNEWSRLFKGRDAAMTKKERPFFHGKVQAPAAVDDAESDRQSMPVSRNVDAPALPQVDSPAAVPQPRQQPAPVQQQRKDDWNVAQFQGHSDDLDLDANGQVIFND